MQFSLLFESSFDQCPIMVLLSLFYNCRGMAWYNSKGCLIRFFKQKCMHSYIQTGTSNIFKTASNNGLVKFKTSTKNHGFDLMIHSYIL